MKQAREERKEKERGCWTDRGRWDGMKQKHTKSCPVLFAVHKKPMCLLFCGRTLAAFAVDNDIVGMNGAHRQPLAACIQTTNTNTVHTECTANCSGCVWSKLVSIHSLFRYRGKCAVQNMRCHVRVVACILSDVFLEFICI